MQKGGSSTPDEAYDISIDAAGNTYTTGYFTGSATFGNTTLNTTGVTDIFIAKMDNSGVYQWAIKAGGTNADRALSIKADASGNTYITGFFFGTATFQNQTVTAVGGQDVFIAKFDNTGTIQWVKSGGGSGADIGNAITIDNSGNIIVTGEFAGSATFGGTTLTSQNNSIDVFTTKLDGSGNFLWAKKGSSASTDRGVDVAADQSGNIYITGAFSDTITFDVAHNNTLYNSIFIVKYNSSGQEQWFRRIGGGTMNVVSGIAIDNNSNIIVTGDFTGNTIFFATPNQTPTSTYSNRIFVAQYDSNGTLNWTHADGSSNSITSKNITIDALGNAYIIGHFKCTLNDYADQYGQGTFNGVGYWDIFVTKYNSSGAWQWSRQCGGPDNDYGTGITTKANDEVIIAGSFFQKIFFPLTNNSFLGYNTEFFNFNYSQFTYCNDVNYHRFAGFSAQGSSDVLIAKNFDLTKGTYDYYLRTGSGCDKPYRGVCINSWFDLTCADSLTVCGGTTIYALPNTYNPFYSDYNAGPTFNYLWSTGATSNNINISTTGNYTVTQTSADGCFVSSDTIAITVNPIPPLPTITDNHGINNHTTTPTSIILCNDSALLTGGSFNPYAYHWQKPDGTSVNDSTVEATKSGFYHFILTNQFNCQRDNPVYVQVDTGQSAFVPKLVCEDDSDRNDTVGICKGNYLRMLVYDTITNPTAFDWACFGYPVNWFINPDTTQMQFITYCYHYIWPKASGNYTITSKIVRQNSCGVDTITLNKTIYVNVYPNPLPPNDTLIISGPNTFCPGDSVLLTATGSHFVWNGPGVTGDTINNVWIHTDGSYFVQSTQVITNSYGCSITDPAIAYKNITFPQQPTVTTNPANGLICPNDSVRLTCSGTGSFLWQGPSGNVGADTSSIYVTIPGNYYCILTDTNGCVLISNTVIINLYATPYLTATPSTILCAGDSLTITAITNPGSTITWQAPLIGGASQQKITGPGIYTCSVTACGIPTFASITITQPNLNAQITANGPLTFCGGDSITLTGNNGINSYLWMPGVQTSQSIIVSQSGTYKLTISDTNNCSDSDSATVIVLPQAIAQFSFTDTCLHDNVTFSNTSLPSNASWLWSFGDNTAISTTNAPLHQYADTGTYNAKLVVTTPGGCKDSLTRSISIRPLPLANFSTNSICEGNSSLFIDSSHCTVDSIIQWDWNWGDNTTHGTTSNGLHLYSNPGNYSTTLIVTSNAGCSDTLTKSLTIYTTPLAQFTSNQVCVGDTTFFTDNSSTTSGTITSWSWNFGDNSTVDTTQSPSHIYTSSGIYTVGLFVKNNIGCIDSIFKTLTIHAIPNVIFNTNNVCDGVTAAFTDFTTIPSTDTLNSWNWNFGDNTPLFTNQLVTGGHLYATPNTYSVKLIVTSNFGCVDSTSQSIIVHPNPVANFGSSKVCNGSSTSFSDSSSTSSGTITLWKWVYDDGSNPVFSQNTTHLYANAGVRSTTLLVQNNFGCADTITKTVKVYFNPIAGFTHTDVCLHDSMHFINTSTVDTSASVVSYFWLFNDNTSSTQQNPTHYYTNQGTYHVTLLIKTSDSCTNAINHDVHVYDSPQAAFTVNNICLIDSIALHNTSQNPTVGTIGNFSWNFGDGSPLNTTLQNPHYHYNTAGLYTITLITQSSNLGCADTTMDSVRVYPMPIAIFSANDVCFGNAINFTDASTVGTPDTVTQWNWNFGGGGASSVLQNPTRTFSSAGTYIVTLVSTSNHGCADTVQHTSVVHPIPTPLFTTQNSCLGGLTTFSDHSTIASSSTNDAIASWSWNCGDNTTSNNNQNATHVYATAGTFTVQLIVTSDYGCRDSVSHSVTINPNPLVNFTRSDSAKCEPFCVTLSDASTIASGANTTWAWDYGDGASTGTGNTTTHCYHNDSVTAPNNYTITLTVSSDSGCVTTLAKTNYITVYPNPHAAFNPNPTTATITNPVIEVADESTGASAWTWNFGGGDTNIIGQHPSPHTYADTGSYTITLLTTTQYSCKDSTYQTIIIEPDFMFYIPNSFTPNDDGVNDTFIGKGMFIKDMEMNIFDRWGNLIYTTTNMDKPWDGRKKDNNELVLQDVYVYSIKVIDYKNEKHNYRGTVTVLKK